MSTTIASLISALRELRRRGGSPVITIDLVAGKKWRLPNLYFLARLLEIEPVVSQLLFTEERGGTDGYFVGCSRPEDLWHRIEQSTPEFGTAAKDLHLPTDLDLSDFGQANTAASAFQTLSQALPATSGADDDRVHGYVTADRIRTMPGIPLDTTAIEIGSAGLGGDEMRAILMSPYRFVPATDHGKVGSLLDRDAVALSVAREAIARR